VNVGGYVAQKSADKLQWKINAAAFAAFMASGAKIVQPKGSIAAGGAPDITAVLGMFQNIPAALRDSAVWFANPRLQTTMMTYVIGQMPVFVPGGSLANAPNDTLLGKRIIWTELAAAVGTEGDLVLVAPKAFYAVTKGAPQASVSTHLYFDADQIAYKTSARVAIKSKFSAPITRPDLTTVGNVATLATR
jgi:HK97 family phage major capsid protein